MKYNFTSKKNFSDDVVDKLNSKPKNLFFNFAYNLLPHMEKRDKGGEDSFSVDKNMLVVADGVGGWNEVGIDPSLYSKELTTNIMKEYKSNPNDDILSIFDRSCKSSKNRGSSTCCICKLDNDKDYIDTLNLGDSGYLILRPIKTDAKINLEIVFKSEEQQHSFNFPYQVGEGGDNPKSAMINKHNIIPKDVVILASDGLWDNLSHENITKIFARLLEKKPELISDDMKLSDLQTICDYITETTEKLSLDKTYSSPFSIKSNHFFKGGKHDDITVIIAQILDSNPKF